MPSLKKSIYNTEIKNILTQYKFLLFFHHNNIPTEEWKFLKTEISYLHDISIKVIKNKITYEILKKLYPENKQNVRLLCQGPNFIIGVNSIGECKNICKILNVQRLFHSSSAFFASKTSSRLVLLGTSPCSTATLQTFGEPKKQGVQTPVALLSKFNHKFNGYSEKNFPKLNLNSHKIKQTLALCVAKQRGLVPGEILFTSKKKLSYIEKDFNINENTNANTKLSLVFKKNEINNKNNGNSTWVPNFIFIGGLFEHKIINNLDLQKLLNLNNSVYTNLIVTVNTLTQKYLFLQNTNVINLLFSLQKINSLLHVLNVHKNNLIKEKNK